MIKQSERELGKMKQSNKKIHCVYIVFSDRQDCISCDFAVIATAAG